MINTNLNLLNIGLGINRGFLLTYLASILRYSVLDIGINSSRIRLRRDSDNAELEFNPINEVVDTVGILAWSTTDSVYVSKAFDKSGHGNHAIQTVASYQPRLINAGVFEVMSDGDYGMLFDGVDDFMDVVDNQGLDITTGDLSLLANFDPGGNGYIFTRNNDDSASVQYGILYDGASTLTKIYLNGASRADDILSVSQNVFVGTYNHIDAISYLDGVLKQQNSYTSNLVSEDNIQIGCRSNSPDGLTKNIFLTGHINRITVFSKALTQAEITYLTSKV